MIKDDLTLIKASDSNYNYIIKIIDIQLRIPKNIKDIKYEAQNGYCFYNLL